MNSQVYREVKSNAVIKAAKLKFKTEAVVL